MQAIGERGTCLMLSMLAMAMPACVLAGDTGNIDVVVPNSAETGGGTGVFLGPLVNSGRIYQLLVHEDQLATLVGKRIVGLSWRLPGSATGDWPANPVEYADYRIFLSEGVAPNQRSLVFADNIVGAQTQVRDGPLAIATGAYPSGQAINPFGPPITVDGWDYAGGHVLVELRHGGFEGTSRAVDAFTASSTGYGSQFSAVWSSNAAATEGLQGNFTVVRFSAEDGDGPVFYTVTPSASAGGDMDPNVPQQVEEGDTTSFTVTADAGFMIDEVTGCGGTLDADLFTTAPITASCTVTASFAEKPPNTWIVTPLAGPGGSLDPGTPQLVVDGDSTPFDVIAEPGFVIDAVSGCDGELDGAVYTTGPVLADCTVTASFDIDPDIIFIDGFELIVP